MEIPKSYFNCMNNKTSSMCPRNCCGSYCPDYKTKEAKKKIEYRYISHSTRYNVLARQHWNCNMCGCKLKYSIMNEFPGEVAHIDHITPFSKRSEYEGDINELSNLQALCPSCNLGKGKKKIH